MPLFEHTDICVCGHTEEDHAMDAPKSEQECMHEEEDGVNCDCENFDAHTGLIGIITG